LDLNDLNFERKWTNNPLFSRKKHSKRGILMFYQLKKTFAGRIKVLGGPHVAHGLDIAQACAAVSF
jgi:hypothetical protein